MIQTTISRMAATLLFVALTTMTAWAETIDGVKYLNDNGAERTANGVTVLTGSETTLSAGWYVAQGTINYDHTINSTGTVHLILADGCKMTVEPSDANATGAINIWDLTIYAQSNGGDAGSLTAIVNTSKDVTTCAITAFTQITINGGNITARSTNTSNSSSVYHSGIAGASGLTINGGNIVATSESTEKGCGLTGKITINWNNDNCSLYFYPYRDDGFNGYMQIGVGKTITDGTNTYSGILNEELKAAITRKLLTPLTRIVTAKGGDDGDYWATFYHKEAGYHAPDGTTAFMTSLDATGHLTLTALTDGIIPKDQAVILKSTAASIVLNRDESASTSDFTDNALLGTMTSIKNPGNAYVLNKGTQGVGFYKLSATGTIGANKAYLTYTAPTTAPELDYLEFTYGNGNTTGVNEVRSKMSDEFATPHSALQRRNEYYDLSGRRVLNPSKGLYIVNGKKIFINK